MQHQRDADRLESAPGELGPLGSRRSGQRRPADVRESDAAALENAAAFDDRGEPVAGERRSFFLAPAISAQPLAVLALDRFDGKAVEKSVNISNLDNEVTAEKVDAVVTALESLLEYPVIETNQYETGLLVE